MRWLDAAEHILREVGAPTHYRDVASAIMQRSLVDTKSQTPESTLHASVTLDIQRRESSELEPRFLLVERGVIGLAEWQRIAMEGAPHAEDPAMISDRSRERAKKELIRKLRALSGDQFEGFLEVLFSKMGYNVTVTGGSGDDGIDLVAELEVGIGAQRVGVQAKCKGANRRIGPNTIRLLRDALSTQQCNAGAVVATCRFHRDAIRVAEEPGKPPVSLVGPDDLVDLALEHKVGIRSESFIAFEENLASVLAPSDVQSGTSPVGNATPQ